MCIYQSRPSSIHIFLADGQPEGFRTVEKPGWTGIAVVCPRTRFPEARTCDEFARPGVYVGEGDPTRDRLEQHFKNKDNEDKGWWTSLIVFTSKDDSLHKAHIQYLE